MIKLRDILKENWAAKPAPHVPKYMYHGTLVDYLPNILKNGLKPSSPIEGVYMTPDRSLAVDMAGQEVIGTEDEHKIRILKINTTNLDRNKFKLDEFPYPLPTYAVYYTDKVSPSLIIAIEDVNGNKKK